VVNTPTLEKWQHARIRTIDLPSGAGDVDVEPCDLSVLLYGDPEENIPPSIPNDLATIAERAEYQGVDAEKMSKDERITLTRFRYWLIADRLRRPKLDRKQVRSLPYDDQIAIFRVCLHMDLSERLMLSSFRGLPAGNEANGSSPTEGSSAE
jgi:hypothetical protein